MIKFNEKNHTYTIDDAEVPSVTTILNIDFEYWKYDNIEELQEKGTSAHLKRENYYTQELKTFFGSSFRFEQQECIVHMGTKYIGRFDAIATVGDKRILIDYKTSRKVMPKHGEQLAAYRDALDGKIDGMYIVLLDRETGNFRQVVDMSNAKVDMDKRIEEYELYKETHKKIKRMLELKKYVEEYEELKNSLPLERGFKYPEATWSVTDTYKYTLDTNKFDEEKYKDYIKPGAINTKLLQSNHPELFIENKVKTSRFTWQKNN